MLASAVDSESGTHTLARRTGFSGGIHPLAMRSRPIARAAFAVAAAAGLAACGSGSEDTLEAVKQEARAAAQESRVAEALDTVIDEQAVEGMARGAINGAVNDAIADILPAEEMATVRAVVDEEAIARSARERFGRADDAAPETTER
ncbi:MAG: hypothetical protein EON93_13970 [Burkholderiales bacterium]|nr:MAG: hypothetical protein EON93_13970 [Burkholderiales bacterium]